jgi:hypothetical protein
MAVRGENSISIKAINKVIDINPALDTRLNATARGIMYYALVREARKKGWKVQLFDLYKQFPQTSKHSIRLAVKELAELDYLTLRVFPHNGKKFQGTYYEIYGHKVHSKKKEYIVPSFERVTGKSLLEKLFQLQWKNEAGDTVYINKFQLQN